jgi:hypothetical protein
LAAENLLLPSGQQIPRAILPRFGMTIWIKFNFTTIQPQPRRRATLTAGGRFVSLPAQVTGAAANLQVSGYPVLRRPFVQDQELGIWTAPGGNKVAWFKDPDGNVLSVSQHD